MSIDAAILSAGANPLPDLVDGPDMRDAVSGWARPVVLKVVTQTAGPGGDAVESSRIVQTSAFLIPVTATKLDIKPDGDGTRKWNYWDAYLLDDPVARIGDKFVIGTTTYKVVKSSNYRQFGFHKFGLQEDFAKS